MSNQPISAAYDDLRNAKQAIVDALLKHYPPGTVCNWSKSHGTVQRGEVIRNLNTRLYVHNWSTGKKYVIHGSDLIEDD